MYSNQFSNALIHSLNSGMLLSFTISIQFFITALSMAREHRALDKIKKYFRITQDYVTANQFVDAEVKTIDFGQTTLYNVKQISYPIQKRQIIYILNPNAIRISNVAIDPIVYNKKDGIVFDTPTFDVDMETTVVVGVVVIVVIAICLIPFTREQSTWLLITA